MCVTFNGLEVPASTRDIGITFNLSGKVYRIIWQLLLEACQEQRSSLGKVVFIKVPPPLIHAAESNPHAGVQ